jgi:hypothetical protein
MAKRKDTGLSRADRKRDFEQETFLLASMFKMKTTGSPTLDAKVKECVPVALPCTAVQTRFIRKKGNDVGP